MTRRGALFEQSLLLYQRIPEPYSIGMTNRRLARLSSVPAERNSHLSAARDAWQSIDRPDLLKELHAEFGEDL